ncbi:MAG TPA: phosphopantetheine adenylyltransferase [Thermoplasmata archaeon]|nr:phosphopantetheine adenylyltransferase [Thermoplasmata archaeon]
MRVCTGGTFDPLHDGHKVLIRKAFEVAGQNGRVTIGLTSDSFATSHHYYKLLSYGERKRNLLGFLSEEGCSSSRYEIVELNDPWGPSLTEDFDAIVVSPETFKSALILNKKRKEKGLKPIKVIGIPLINAEDGKPICSTRIYKKEIDKHGKVLPKKLN